MKPIPKPLTMPWAISEEGRQLVLSVWSRGDLFATVREQALAARDGKPLENTRTVTERNGIAIVPVDGPLFRKADMLTEISGATTYERLRKDLQAAVDNTRIRGILLQVNSPGGEADGCNELAQFIRECSDKKPIWSYVGGMGASGALWLISATSRIICAETAFVGSIGVRQMIVDDSARDAANGVREVEIISSQSPDKRSTPVDDELIARYRARIDDLAEIFIRVVAENRGVTPEVVMSDFGRGDVMIASRAVEVGMVDALGSFESALADLAGADPISATTRTSPAKENAMSTKSNPTPTASMQAEKCDACGVDMGPQSKSYCSQCFEKDDDDEDDEDEKKKKEDEAKSLGLSPSASNDERRARVSDLVQFEQRVVALTGTASSAEAIGKIGKSVESVNELTNLRTELGKERSEGVRRDLRATLETGLDKKTIDLGTIQKKLGVVLHGESKAAWSAAMGKIKTVTRASVLDAACSVDLSREYLASINEYVNGSALVAAEPFNEPKRDSEAESKELSPIEQQIKAVADQTRATLDGKKAANLK